MVIAAAGHSRTHLPQAMQPDKHFFRVTAPFSILLHKTETAAWAFCAETEINLFGHSFTHKPQPVQSFVWMRARPYDMQIAWLGHTLWQSP